MINSKIYIALGAVILLFGASTYFLANALIDTRVELATTTQALATLSENVLKMQREQKSFLQTSNDITSEFNRQKRELEGLKNREEVILAKRSLVQLRINKAFTKDQLELACLSGDLTACEQQ